MAMSNNVCQTAKWFNIDTMIVNHRP
ncbi:MAG: tryptophanase leader peptide [Pluralibacter sp.]|nr:tryptophanase leader peptide [Pluralibacter sp.]